jgi:cytochrome c peroxidase
LFRGSNLAAGGSRASRYRRNALPEARWLNALDTRRLPAIEYPSAIFRRRQSFAGPMKLVPMKLRIRHAARAALLSFAVFAGFGVSSTAIAEPPAQSEPMARVRVPMHLDRARVALGEKLFRDPVLSGRGMLACTSCHDLEKGGTVGQRRTIGYQGKMHRFNAPSIFNVGNNYRLGWRGEFTDLKKQNERVLLDENLMAVEWETLLERLRGIDSYGALFREAYERDMQKDDVLDALAAFQRSLVTTNAPFDQYLAGNDGALSKNAVRGYELFREYGCSSCHQGANVGGNMFQKFGIFVDPPSRRDGSDESDLGRWSVTRADRDIGVFRVPSLRNVEVTAPYFHDGRTDTLPEAVEIMARSQLGRELEHSEIAALVAFLESLTGEYNGRRLSATPLEGRR